MSRSFASIRESNQFFDCTLSTDDDEAHSDNLKAHKVLLAASSEFFRKLLAKESICAHTNPLIYLRGISAQDLTHILDFIYHGEVNVEKYELDKFLEVAETLKIQGLAQSVKTETVKYQDLPQNLNNVSKRPLPPPPLTILPFQSEQIKKPKMNSAMTPSPYMPKMEAKEHALAEKNSSIDIVSDDFDYDPRENNEYASADEDITEHFPGKFEEDNDEDDYQTSGTRAHENGKISEHKVGYKGKHLSEAEKITLVNLIKTLDKEDILRKGKHSKNHHATNEKRRALWSQIMSAFNEICGLDCDMNKLKNTLKRIKQTTYWKSHSLLYDDVVEC